MVTGHRLFNSDSQSEFAQQELTRLAWKLSERHGATVGISGMAIGTDQWWAEAVLDAGMELWAYLPLQVSEL